jgi:hypothetical protein
VSFRNLPLVISLVFGAAQAIFGVVVLAHGLRAGRWRRTGTFLLLVLGAWALCSGLAELVVSGMVATARMAGAPEVVRISAVRQAADTALVVATLALLALLLGYSIWRRSTTGGRPPLDIAGHED